ncbi:twin-arginine translocation signal domain-containing protein [Streptomyces scabiei]|uniref:twin-arginine translocation signal domain-containing protein n=1 Tax=Streptomyces scabiei TaxID=1930 RepID=UPI0029B611A2|nr:twin-arginine translocation signal domain-containing protein [Streptomyces scabiei]MDX2861942.1 twin-arginine translocation signal domain-containing protein [Streptomyces scabiei]
MTEPIHPSRRTVVTALGVAAAVALPAWPETAHAGDGSPPAPPNGCPLYKSDPARD